MKRPPGLTVIGTMDLSRLQSGQERNCRKENKGPFARLGCARHVMTDTEAGVLDGRFDSNIAEQGRADARSLGNKIRWFGIHVAFAPRYIRAMGTLEGLLEGKGQSAIDVRIVEKWLDPQDWGKLTGKKPLDLLEYSPEEMKRWKRTLDGKPPGGESRLEAMNRAADGYRQEILPLLNDGKNVLVVSCGSPLAGIDMAVRGLDAEKTAWIARHHGSIQFYDFEKNGCGIRLVGSNNHLQC